MRWPALLLLTTVGCGQPPASAPAEPPRWEGLRRGLEGFERCEGAPSPYSAADLDEVEACRAAGAALARELRPLWRARRPLPRRAAGEQGVAAGGPGTAAGGPGVTAGEPSVAADGPGVGAAEPGGADGPEAPAARSGAPPSCRAARCCAPSRPPPPSPPRPGVIVLTPLCCLRPPTPEPSVVTRSLRVREGLGELGASLLAALEAGETEAPELAGLLLAEVELRAREAAFAWEPGQDFRCGATGSLLRELAGCPAVAERAAYQLGVCLDREGRQEAREVLGRLPPGPLRDEAELRLALADLRDLRVSLDEPLRRLDRAASAGAGRSAALARLAAADVEARLDRFSGALAELAAAAAAAPDDALVAEVASRRAAAVVIDWLDAVSGCLALLEAGVEASDEPGCGGAEVLAAWLGPEPALLRDSLGAFARAAFAMTLYRESVEAARALLELAPNDPHLPETYGLIRDALTRERDFAAARGVEAEARPALGPGSAWRAGRSAEEVARADAFLASFEAPRASGERVELQGALDRRAALREAERLGLAFEACFWGSQPDAPAWARLLLAVDVTGRVSVESVEAVPDEPGVASCLAAAARRLEVPPPEGGVAALELIVLL